MKYFKKIILVVFASFLVIVLKAQYNPIQELYIFDYMLVNPSFTGLSSSTAFKIAHRQQWTGIKEAPNTSFLLFRHRIRDRDGGIGGYIYSDQNGPNAHYGAQVSGSFHVLLKSNRKRQYILSFGMSVRADFHVLDESKFDQDIYDPIINYNVKTTFLPNANFGILLSTTKAFVGYSIDNLIPMSDKMYDLVYEPLPFFLHNFHIGKIFEITDDRQIRPSIMFKTNMKGMNQIDANLRFFFMFNKRVSNSKSPYLKYLSEFWIGALYRHTMDRNNISPLSVAPAFGITTNKFSISYLYDLGLSKIQKYNYGTHQITLGIKFYHDPYKNWNKFYIPQFEYDF